MHAQAHNVNKQPRRWARWFLLPLVLMIVLLFGLLALSACGLLPGGLPFVPAGAVPATATAQPPATAAPTPVETQPAPQVEPSPAVEATYTAAPLPTATATVTQLPTEIPTQVPTLPAASPTPTDIPARFQAQAGAPWYIPAFAHTEQGCQWVGLAGQVFDEYGQGMEDVLVVVRGTLEDKPVEWLALTAMGSSYGPGGYELALIDHIPAGPQTLAIQLYDLQGQVLTGEFSFALPDACERNLAVVNFQAAQQE